MKQFTPVTLEGMRRVIANNRVETVNIIPCGPSSITVTCGESCVVFPVYSHVKSILAIAKQIEGLGIYSLSGLDGNTGWVEYTPCA